MGHGRDPPQLWQRDRNCGRFNRCRGCNVLDRREPEAMDLPPIAREFGGNVAFSGGISAQEIVGFTPSQVRDHVHRAIDTLGKAFGNAYLGGPSYHLPPEIPIGNLQALFEACHNQ